MPDGPSVGFVAKAGLTTARIMDKPFEVPTKLTVSSAKTGEVVTNLIGATNGALKTAYDSLEPKGPAKWLDKVFDRVNNSAASSLGKAARNTNVFWAPMSAGASQVGDAVAGPLVSHYLKKAGYPDPTDGKTIHDVLHGKGYPTPDPAAEGPPPEQQGAAAPPEAGPTTEAPPQEAPPQEAPPQEAPPQEAPPQEAPPQEAPPQ